MYARHIRQYQPDFTIAVRDGHDGEAYWLVETKGEIRPNTPVKSQAARDWCRRMTGTQHGAWRYLLLPQRRFEAALGAGIPTLTELVGFLGV